MYQNVQNGRSILWVSYGYVMGILWERKVVGRLLSRRRLEKVVMYMAITRKIALMERFFLFGSKSLF